LNRTGACLFTFLNEHTSWIFDVQFDKTKIISASQDQRILIIDFATGLNNKYF
jgi:F-box and WD-40 domain protein 1/11